MYVNVPSYAEMLEPVGTVVQALHASALFDAWENGCDTEFILLRHQLEDRRARVMQHRRWLTREALVPTIREYQPAYIEGYNPSKGVDPDKERAQIKKLTQKMKREKRGAMRELRRDGAFLARQRDEAFERDEQERKAKVQRVMSILQVEQRDSNIMARMAKKRKQR
jgi:nucleolar protein 14